ncbi:hypothetical protein, partial [Chamaesiphon sp. OTE_8_metabat_110]
VVIVLLIGFSSKFQAILLPFGTLREQRGSANAVEITYFCLNSTGNSAINTIDLQQLGSYFIAAGKICY